MKVEVGSEQWETLLKQIKSNNKNIYNVSPNLNLSNSQINDKGAKELSLALKDNQTITYASLSYNEIGSEGAKAIASLLSHNSTLTYLDLGWNSLGNEGGRNLVLGLKNNRSLIDLNLEGNGINDIQVIAQILDNDHITSLNIGHNFNDITDDDVKFLAKALKDNHTLRTLNLATFRLEAKGIKMLAPVLKNHSTLTSLGMAACSLDDEAAIILSSVLKSNRILTSLCLKANSIRTAGANAISQELKNNYTLTSLNLHFDYKYGNLGGRMNEGEVEVREEIDLLLTRNQGLRDQLHKAVSANKLETVRSLISQGVSLLSQTGKEGNTPLHWAVEYQFVKMVEFLLQEMKNRHISLSFRNKYGKTAKDLIKEDSHAIWALLNNQPYLQNQSDNDEAKKDFAISFLPELKNSKKTETTSVNYPSVKKSPIVSSIPKSKISDKSETSSLTFQKSSGLTSSPLNKKVPQPISWQELQMEELIGYGGFGEVYRATWFGKKVAVKQLYLKTLSTDLKNSFDQETNLMAHCHFPNVVQLLGVCLEPGHYAMIMEYMPKGSLYSVLQNQTIDLPWVPFRWQIAIDVGKGLTYLHSQNIIHQDLKSLNVLLDAKYQAKISDFGLSRIKLETTSTTSHASKKTVGSVRWRAPELFKRKASPNFSSDIYSYGVILWEIATRKLPFADALDEVTVVSWVTAGTKEDIPNDCPEDYRYSIEQCWAGPDARPTAQKLVDGLQKKSPKLHLIAEPERSWHFDITTKPASVPQNASYVLVDASSKDIEKVTTHYLHHPVPGMDLKRVQVIYSPTMNRGFELRMQMLENRHKQSAFDPKWQHENEEKWREEVNQLALSMAKPYTDPTYPHVKLLPLWHGTKPEILNSIFETGYANLATTDSGFFGKGIYSSYEAEYAYRVYSKGALLLNWVCFYSAYPTIHGDMSKLQGGPNYKNYDAHFVPVIPPDGKISYQVAAYYPCKPNQAHQYVEVVVFESQCLPRYLVELQPSFPKEVPLLKEEKNDSKQNTQKNILPYYSEKNPNLIFNSKAQVQKDISQTYLSFEKRV